MITFPGAAAPPLPPVGPSPPGDPAELRAAANAFSAAATALVDRSFRVQDLQPVPGWQSRSADAYGARMRSIGGRLRTAALALGDVGRGLGELAWRLDGALTTWAQAKAILEVAGRSGAPEEVARAQRLFAQARDEVEQAQRRAQNSIAAATSTLASLTKKAAERLPTPPPAPVINPCGLFPQEASSFFWNNGMIPLDTICLVYTEVVIEVDGAPVTVYQPVPLPPLFAKDKGKGGTNRIDTGNEPLLTDQEKVRIKAKIQRALVKGDAGIKFQAAVAQNVRIRGIQVIRFGEKVFDRFGNELGDVDFETQNAIVEVTTSAGGKVDQTLKIATNRKFNPRGKPVIVYAPKYRPDAESSLTSHGIRVARGMDELVKMLRGG